jgi:hypothetical protein
MHTSSNLLIAYLSVGRFDVAAGWRVNRTRRHKEQGGFSGFSP